MTVFAAAALTVIGGGASAVADEVPQTTDFYGEQVDVDVVDYLNEYADREGIDLESELGGISPRASDRGGVEVPAEYLYKPSLGARHDYCTNSPD